MDRKSNKTKTTKRVLGNAAAAKRQQTTGWRYWQALTDGHLSPGVSPREQWLRDGVTAYCTKGRHSSEPAPSPDCACGLRVMPELADLLHAIRTWGALGLGLCSFGWMARGGVHYYCDRERHGVLHVPDVIGEVIAWGRIEDGSVGDPAGTLRAAHARVGRVLHLSSHIGYMAPKIRACYPGTVVRVGEARGLAWLDEIAAIGDQVGEGGE